MTPLEMMLYEALKKAEDHLEYCGYGDTWERKIAIESDLSGIIKKALKKYEEDLP